MGGGGGGGGGQVAAEVGGWGGGGQVAAEVGVCDTWQSHIYHSSNIHTSSS